MKQCIQLLILLSVLCLLAACGKAPKDERVYGTWTEISTGEIVEFRRDGTLAWFGQEGTFEFRKSTNWASCIGMSGCPTGQVGIDVGGEGFRASYYSSRFNDDPDSWYLSFRSFSAMPYDVTIDGRTAGGFQLYRQGTIESPMVLPGFQKADTGLSERFPQASKMRKYGGELVADIGRSMHRFNPGNQTWTDLGVDSYGLNFADSVIFTSDQYSLDLGYTWNEIPFLEGYSHEGETAAHGTTLYKTSRVDEDGEPVSRQTWRLDLNDSSPAWEMVGEEATSDYFGRQIVSVANAAALMRWVNFYEENTVQLERSYDEGATWNVMASECVTEVRPHTEGVYCGASDGTVRWYSVASDSWTQNDTVFYDAINSSDGLHDALYVDRDEQIIRVELNGSEEVMVDYGDVRRRPGMFVFDDEIWLSCYTLWRKSL